MKVKELLKIASRRRSEWLEKEEKNCPTLEGFFLNQIFEDSWSIEREEGRELMKELAAYILDIKEDKWGRCENFMEHLKEYTYLLDEEAK